MANVREEMPCFSFVFLFPTEVHADNDDNAALYPAPVRGQDHRYHVALEASTTE